MEIKLVMYYVHNIKNSRQSKFTCLLDLGNNVPAKSASWLFVGCQWSERREGRLWVARSSGSFCKFMGLTLHMGLLFA